MAEETEAARKQQTFKDVQRCRRPWPGDVYPEGQREQPSASIHSGVLSISHRSGTT